MKKWRNGLVALSTLLLLSATQFADTAEAKSLTDISTSHPYYKIINEMVEQSIISGYEDGTFRPDENINLQHAALLITNTVEPPSVSKYGTKMNDVHSTHPYFKAIRKLLMSKAIYPDENGNVYPTEPITRGEMAKFITLAFQLEARVNYDFVDTKEHENSLYIQTLYSNGITSGYEDGTFRPDEPISRAHFTVFMYKALNLDKSVDFVPEPIDDDQAPQQPMPLKPSLNIEDYPSDRLVTQSMMNQYDIRLPNGEAWTVENRNSFSQAQKEKVSELDIMVNGIGGSALWGWREDSEIDFILETLSNQFKITVPEFVQIINYVYDTGEVYNGGNYWVCFDYSTGIMIDYGLPLNLDGK